MRLIDGLTNWKMLIPLFIAIIYFTTIIFADYQAQINTIANENLTSLDARLTYNKTEVFTLLTKMRQEGRAVYYFVSSKIDLLYPVLYGTFFIILLKYLAKPVIKPNSRWRLVILLPVLSVAFDYSENIAIQQLLMTYPNITEQQVALASWMTLLKWFMLAGVLLLVGVLAVAAAIHKLKVCSVLAKHLKHNCK